MTKSAALEPDFQPISRVRAKASSFVKQVRKTGQPVVITRGGENAAVLLDVGEYERIMRRKSSRL